MAHSEDLGEDPWALSVGSQAWARGPGQSLQEEGAEEEPKGLEEGRPAVWLLLQKENLHLPGGLGGTPAPLPT